MAYQFKLCVERLRRELAQEDLLLKDGLIPLPTEVGLGVEVNWDAVKACSKPVY